MRHFHWKRVISGALSQRVFFVVVKKGYFFSFVNISERVIFSFGERSYVSGQNGACIWVCTMCQYEIYIICFQNPGSQPLQCIHAWMHHSLIPFSVLFNSKGPLMGGPQCRLSILRNGNVPCHYF